MDLKRLRDLLEPILVDRLHSFPKQDEMPAFCESLGMPIPPDAGTKRERMRASFTALLDSNLLDVAHTLLQSPFIRPSERNPLQDFLWASLVGPSINKKVRRAIADELDGMPLYADSNEFDKLLDNLFVMMPDPFAFLLAPTLSLAKRIEKHVHQNDDWSYNALFSELDVLNISDRRFTLLLQGLVSPAVRPDEPEQRRVVALMNKHLITIGVEMKETGEQDGYPVYTILSAHSSTERPKNLIFASRTKPDIRLVDAVQNKIEIVTGAESVLVYDRPIPDVGLRWKELQDWWAAANGIPNDNHAKTTLYKRLLAELPDSPPQQYFFKAYFKVFTTAIPLLPALLPEVWLHWDPKTVKQRGPDSLPRFRMDFLMLLPHNVRVVLEVDGKHHCAIDDRADPGIYAKMVAADRELKVNGYEVYRFGGAELDTIAHSETILRDFFAALFRRHQVVYS